MNSTALSNLIDPAILFFFLGVLVGAVRSNLEIPPQVAKFLSLYLLMSLGFKGGQELSKAGLGAEGFKMVSLAVLLALTIPAAAFLVLRRRVNQLDAAAIAATYGSVSAVTFIAATNFVAGQGTPSGGYSAVAMVLMETPAIVMAVVLASWVRSRQHAEPNPVSVRAGSDSAGLVSRAPGGPLESVAEGASVATRDALSDGDAPVQASSSEPLAMRSVLHEALTDGANLLLLGSLVVGAVSGSKGGEAMQPFTNGIFKGLLAFFLLEMGLLVARHLREVRDVGPFLIGFGLITPLCSASVALLLGSLIGLAVGDLTVLAVLAASASYIAVPAVVRYAIPEARPSRYFTMALAVTFPFNVVIGIPLYYAAAQALAG
ncbi:MAG: sodium-dependent bicarbonate transport family permease [Actinomycetes bacterium]